MPGALASLPDGEGASPFFHLPRPSLLSSPGLMSHLGFILAVLPPSCTVASSFHGSPGPHVQALSSGPPCTACREDPDPTALPVYRRRPAPPMQARLPRNPLHQPLPPEAGAVSCGQPLPPEAGAISHPSALPPEAGAMSRGQRCSRPSAEPVMDEGGVGQPAPRESQAVGAGGHLSHLQGGYGTSQTASSPTCRTRCSWWPGH